MSNSFFSASKDLKSFKKIQRSSTFCYSRWIFNLFRKVIRILKSCYVIGDSVSKNRTVGPRLRLLKWFNLRKISALKSWRSWLLTCIYETLWDWNLRLNELHTHEYKTLKTQILCKTSRVESSARFLMGIII